MGTNFGNNSIQQTWQAQNVNNLSDNLGESAPYIPALHAEKLPDSFEKKNPDAEKKKKDETLNNLAYTAGGTAGAWGAGYGLHKLVTSKSGHENAPIMKFSRWLDKSFIVDNSASKKMGKWIDSARAKVSKTHKSLMGKESYAKIANTYNAAVPANHTAKELLDKTILQHGNAADIVKALKKINPEDAKKLGELVLQPNTEETKKAISGIVQSNEAKLHKSLYGRFSKLSEKLRSIKNPEYEPKYKNIENIRKAATSHQSLIGELKKVDSAVAAELNKILKDIPKGSVPNTETAKKVAATLNKLSPEKLETLGLKEAVNKVSIATGATKTSRLSKFISDKVIGTGNFLKNGGGLGALFVVFNGWMIGNSIKEAREAPKGEKMSTFAEDMLGNWIGMFATWPLLEKGINGVANLKNMQANTVTQKLAKGLGKVVGFGMPGKLGTKVGLAKRAPGMLLRGVILIGGSTLMSYPFKKLSHLIFGKPHHKEQQKSSVQQAMTTPVVMNKAVHSTIDGAKNVGMDFGFQGLGLFKKKIEEK